MNIEELKNLMERCNSGKRFLEIEAESYIEILCGDLLAIKEDSQGIKGYYKKDINKLRMELFQYKDAEAETKKRQAECQHKFGIGYFDYEGGMIITKKYLDSNFDNKEMFDRCPDCGKDLRGK